MRKAICDGVEYWISECESDAVFSAFVLGYVATEEVLPSENAPLRSEESPSKTD